MSSFVSAVAAGPRTRGRPTVLDPEAVSAAALALWSERGYADTGWAELAEATAISVRTLTRHFGTKSALAWVGVQGATDRLRTALAELPEQLPVNEAVRRGILASMAHGGLEQDEGRRWLRLIAVEPELAATAPEGYAPWTQALSEYLRSRLPHADDAVCGALAAGYQVMTFHALAAWAGEGGAGSAAEAVSALLDFVAIPAAVQQ